MTGYQDIAKILADFGSADLQDELVLHSCYAQLKVLEAKLLVESEMRKLQLQSKLDNEELDSVAARGEN